MGGVITHDDDTIVEKMNIFLGNDPRTPYMELFPNFRKYFNDYEAGLISEKEVWQGYEKETGKKMKDYGESLFTKFFNPTLHEPTLKVIEKIKEKGIRVVCGTNVLPAHYDYHNRYGQYDIFDRVYGSNWMKVRKPSLEYFKKILESENTVADEAFFTDDRFINVDAARELGIHAYLYKDEVELKKQLKEVGVL